MNQIRVLCFYVLNLVVNKHFIVYINCLHSGPPFVYCSAAPPRADYLDQVCSARQNLEGTISGGAPWCPASDTCTHLARQVPRSGSPSLPSFSLSETFITGWETDHVFKSSATPV